MNNTIKQSEATNFNRRLYFTMVNSADLQERLNLDIGGAEVVGRFPPPLVRIMKPGTSSWDEATNAVVPVDVSSLIAGSDAMPGTCYVELTTTEVNALGPGLLLIEPGTPYDGCATIEPREIPFVVVAFDPYAATNLGLSKFADIETDTQNIQTRIPAALVSGRIDASVGAMAANVMTASALATDAVTEIQSGLATAAALTIVDDFLDTEIAAIKAKTDLLPSVAAGSGAGGLIIAASGSGGQAYIDSGSQCTLSDLYRIKGGVVPTPTNTGIPRVDPYYWNGTAVAAPTTPGVPRVDVKAMEASTLTASALATDAVTEIATAVEAAQAAIHGAGSWETGTGGATAEEIADEVETRTLDANVTKWGDTDVAPSGTGTKHPLLP